MKRLIQKKNEKVSKEYKICVYCICKNESEFVDRFMDSLEEIKDHVYVLDTGSTDNTIELFKKRGANVVQKKYEQFKFDEARNDSLKYVPEDYDICICMDIDEIIKKGFTDVINKLWKEDTTQIAYPFYCLVDENDNPIRKFINNKIHARKNFKWIYPIHEVLEYQGNCPKIIETNEIMVMHKPDCNKSREFYLDLLETRVKEEPEDTRNIALLAGEYKSRNMWIDAIKMCNQYLNVNKPKIISEKIRVLCILSCSYRAMKLYNESILWAEEALKEPEITREPYMQMIYTYYENKKYEELIRISNDALKIERYNTNIIDSAECWDGTIYDYLSLAYYYIKDYDSAIKYINLDIEKNPNISRLKENKILFENAKRTERDNKNF